VRSAASSARWRGHLQRLLPARAALAPVKHHKALPYAEVPAFMAALRQQAGTAARCLELTILTAARTGEAIGGRWSEVDLEAKLWRVPAGRMKGGREHVLPLSGPALEILARCRAAASTCSRALAPAAQSATWQWICCSAEWARARSPSMGSGTASGTGRPSRLPTRTTWSRWRWRTRSAKVEAAYRRGDLMSKRQRLMRDWARYCYRPTGVDAAE
jgi:integrase